MIRASLKATSSSCSGVGERSSARSSLERTACFTATLRIKKRKLRPGLSRLCPAPHPVADEIHGHGNPCKEERCDAPSRRVSAAMSTRVCEDAG